MPSFLHAADLHLDSPLTGLESYEGAPVDEIRGATRAALDNLVALAIDAAVDAVLLAGDIYDGDWRDYNTGLFFARQMARLKEAAIPVLMVHGNHDAASQISRQLRLPDNVHVFSCTAPESRRIDAAGLIVHGQSYPTRQIEQDLTRQYPAPAPDGFNIGLLHTSLDGRPGHATYAPCRLDDLRRLGYDYWALGHVHQRELVAESPWVVFPGNPQGRHIRETGSKGATLVQIENNQVQTLEHRPLDVVRWALCEVSLDKGGGRRAVEEPVFDQLRDLHETAEGRLLAVRIRLTGRTPHDGDLRAHAEQLLNQYRTLGFEIASQGLWIEKLVIATQRPTRPVSATSQSVAENSAPDPLLESLLDPSTLASVDSDAPTPQAAALLQDIDELVRKLPVSLTSGEDGLELDAASLTRPDGDLHQCLHDAHALLLQRLSTAQGEPPDNLMAD